MTAEVAATRVMADVARELRETWRESGACANYHERATVSETNDDASACAGCGISGVAHRLLKWAERLDRAAARTTA